MPRTVLREFTGGLSDEIDPQNLRNDQGEVALDINLKGFALEPGEGTTAVAPDADGQTGHYYYRGEWVRDSKAVSFEESGIGVIKTYDDERPKFEEIIKSQANVSRDVGPPLPPSAVISGTIVSEGTRGERPGEGSHLLKLPGTTLGVVDKAVGSTTAPSLKTFETDVSTAIDDIHFYNGDPYWIVKTGNNWQIKTRVWSGTAYLSTFLYSSTLTHHSSGYFFKEGYFVCWDNQWIESVPLTSLQNTSMTADSIDTITIGDGGDGGKAFLPNEGKTASSNFETGATATSITGVDINGGMISFSQRITTANTLPTAYTDSPNERWLRMPSGSNGCFVVLLRDGMQKSTSESFETGNYSEADDDVEIWTDKNEAVFKGSDTTKGWITPTGKLKIVPEGGAPAESKTNTILSDTHGDVEYGFKYGVVYADNSTWVRILYKGVKYPEIMVLENATANTTKSGEKAAKEVYATRQIDTKLVGQDRDPPLSAITGNVIMVTYSLDYLYQDYLNIELIFPSIKEGYFTNDFGNKFKVTGNRIHWKYTALTVPKTFPSGNTHSYSSIVRTGRGSDFVRFVLSRNFLWDVTTKISVEEESEGTQPEWVRYLGDTNKNLSNFDNRTKKETQLGKNNLTTPTVPGKMHRLCSFTPPGGTVVQQEDFSASELWTKATFSSVDNSIAFPEAKNKNFRKGDWIKIGQNGSNKSMHLNLRGFIKNQNSHTQSEQSYITAKIIGIEDGVKLLLSPPEIDHLKTKKYIDEECYPLITTFISYNESGKITTDSDGPTASVIQSDLSGHVLVGHGSGRLFDGVKGDQIEVRLLGGAALTGTAVGNNTHQIDWSNGEDVRAVTQQNPSMPRIFYTKVVAGKKSGSKIRNLFSQNGSQNITPNYTPFSVNGKYYVDKNYLTYVDNKDITIFSPNFQEQYVKARPKLATGLGLTGDIQDARTFVTSSNTVYVCVKISDYWKLVKTSGSGPETSLLKYDFKIPLYANDNKIWGIGSNALTPSVGWDIETAIPFYESSIIGSMVFFASTYYDGSNSGAALTPTKSAWGEVIDSRIGEADSTGTPRYLSIDWQMDSGDWFSTGTPTIGLNHETGKMIEANTFKWYPIQPSLLNLTLTTGGVGTVITDMGGTTNPFTPLASIEISFESLVRRDIVFFKKSETLLPGAGDTGGENKIVFLNYDVTGQSFYVLSDNAFGLAVEPEREPEKAYRLGQSNLANHAFDASRVGISTFLIGAPNMFNAYGPNIDFYYRASFINKWGFESAPSPLPNKGVNPLDSADDCIQLNFSAPFFDLTNAEIKTIRLYRYGGDSSEFLYLRDIDMPVLPENAQGVKIFPTVSGFNSVSGVKGGGAFTRKSATSPFYLLNTNYDISVLGGFVNSNFEFAATPTTLDGSWRINQLSENPAPSPAFATILTTELTATAVEVVLSSTTAPSAWPISGVAKIDDEYISYGSIDGLKLKECTRGIYNSNAVVHKIKDKANVNTPVTVVEWILEMEHRNQDTTELTIAIESDQLPIAGSANVFYVADTSVFLATGSILIGNDIYSYTGKTTAGEGNPIAAVTSFTGVAHTSGPNNAHKTNVLVRSMEAAYTSTTINLTGTSIVIDGFGYRDKARTPIASLHAMQVDNWPPLGMKYNENKKQFFETQSNDDYFRYIKAVGSMYFGALDANLRFSKYGTPEYWPLEAVVTLDSEIRCIEEHAGEGIVFTTNSVYRVRGTDPKAMIAFRVPDAKGLPSGYEHTVSDFNGGLMWLTASDGIVMYKAGKVTYLTRDKHNIGGFKFPYSCVADGVYWLFQEPGSGLGYRLELTAGEMRLAQTSIEAYYAYFAKALGIAIVVTKDGVLNSADVDSSGNPLFIAEEVGGAKVTNIAWKSKKIDAGEPAIPKALGSIAIVYEALNTISADTFTDGIRGQALAAELLGLDPDDLDAGDIEPAELEGSSDLYSIFTKYDEPDQAFTIDIGGGNLTSLERRTILMPPIGFDISTVVAGDRIWNELLADNTVVESTTTTTISGVVYPSIVLNNEPLRTGTGTIYWGNLPLVEIYLNNDDTPSRVFTLPPGNANEPQSMDLYLNDLKRFRTISVAIQGNMRVQALSLRHYPLQRYQSATLHHSADVFYKGDIDFRVMLDGSLVYRKELTNAGGDFKEERIYLPASSFGQRVHYMNESRTGMIESVKFNGSVAA